MSLTSIKASVSRKIAALTLVCAIVATSLPVTAYAAVSPSDIQANVVSSSDSVQIVPSAQSEEVSSVSDKNADCPIIIVPGIMGSKLYQENARGRDDLVWAVSDITRPDTYLWMLDALSILPGKDTNLGDEIDISNELYVLHNSDKQNELPSFLREYGAADSYTALVDTLCDEFGEDRDIYFFSYDWRQTNRYSAQKLNEQIENVLKGTEFNKVDLVCHSMGGYVASCYVSQYGSSKIRKVITCGTPYEGAAAILDRTLSNKVIENTVADLLITIAGLNSQRKAELPSMSELIPSEAYVTADGTFSKGDKILGIFGLNKHSVEKINYSQYSELCRDIYGENFDKGKSFYNGIQSSGYNVLADLDNSYFIVGIQQQTVRSVTFTSGLDIPGFNKNGVAVTDAQYGNGDGTVGYISATMLSRLKNKVGEDRYIEIATNHGGTAGGTSKYAMGDDEYAGALKALTYITEILGDKPVTVKSDEYQSQGSVVIRLDGAADVKVSRDGETLDSSAGSLSTLTSFGRLDFMGVTGEIKMLCLDNGNYNISLDATADGTIEYTIRWFDEDNNLTDERTFDSITVTENTTISTNSVNSDDTVLYIDNDSDGTTDEKWSAAENSDGVLISGNYTVTLNKSALTLNQGDISRIKAEVSPSDWHKLQLTWTSSDKSVAKVGSYGEILAVGAGKAVITATMPNGAKASCEITVKAADKHNVTVSANSGGYVSPVGTNTVKSGRSMNIIVMPNKGYYIKSITKNGEEVTPCVCVSLKNIQQDYTVEVKFEKITKLTLKDIEKAFRGM